MNLLFYFFQIQQIKKNEVQFEDNKTVQKIRKRLSSLTGFLSPFFSNQQNEKIDLLEDKTQMDKINNLKESIVQRINLIEEILSSQTKIEQSSNENEKSFKNLEKGFEQFADDLGQKESESQFKKTLQMFSNNFQRTSYNFQQVYTESNSSQILLKFLLEDIKELKQSIQNFKQYRDKIDNMMQQQYQVNQQFIEETQQEYKQKLTIYIENLEKVNKVTNEDKKNIMENYLNKMMQQLLKIQDEWND